MVFSSHLFFYYFLPAALALYYPLPQRGRHLALTLLSYLFYGWSNPLFVVLLFASTTVDYLCGRVIEAGHIVFTGGLTAPFDVTALSHYTAACSQLGIVEITADHNSEGN